MKTIDVYQCELDKTIPLEYVGRVKYIGESFGVDSLTNGKEYNLVKDKTGWVKVVDDSEGIIFMIFSTLDLAITLAKVVSLSSLMTHQVF